MKPHDTKNISAEVLGAEVVEELMTNKRVTKLGYKAKQFLHYMLCYFIGGEDYINDLDKVNTKLVITYYTSFSQALRRFMEKNEVDDIISIAKEAGKRMRDEFYTYSQDIIYKIAEDQEQNPDYYFIEDESENENESESDDVEQKEQNSTANSQSVQNIILLKKIMAKLISKTNINSESKERLVHSFVYFTKKNGLVIKNMEFHSTALMVDLLHAFIKLCFHYCNNNPQEVQNMLLFRSQSRIYIAIWASIRTSFERYIKRRVKLFQNEISKETIHIGLCDIIKTRNRSKIVIKKKLK
ncbi:MAG: hypothetical protein QXF12_02960 [Candidatus Aenigmatarchaeota archaeon]